MILTPTQAVKYSKEGVYSVDRLEKRLRLGNPMPLVGLLREAIDPESDDDTLEGNVVKVIEVLEKNPIVCPHCGGGKYDVIQIWEPNPDNPHEGYEGKLYGVATATCASCGANYDIILAPVESRPIEEEGGNP